ncbi:MAG: hypothetical protein GX446_10430 [Chthonomonadales bacterium]|nr:hypothetical protein [Chthonomonadales bacterium]
MRKRRARMAPLQTGGLSVFSIVPEEVRVVGDWIEWKDGALAIGLGKEGERRMRAKRGRLCSRDLSKETDALGRFVEIKTGEDAAAFVRRYGALRRRPERVEEGDGEVWREPVEVYVGLAEEVRLLRDAAWSLRNRGTLSARELRGVGIRLEDGDPLPDWRERCVMLGVQLSRLAAEAGLQPWVVWDGDRYRIGTGPSLDADAVRAYDAGYRQVKMRVKPDGSTEAYCALRPSALWGYLVSCLIWFVLGADRWHPCTRCGRLHERRRAPNRSGGAAYCEECREVESRERVRQCRARKACGAASG